MSLRETILGLPFVYNVIRPLVVGGIDMAPVFSAIEITPSDTVFDVGCGTGVALEHLPRFKRYVGFDTEELALGAARKQAARRGGMGESVEFRCKTVGRTDVEELRPDVVLLAGVLHHLDDSTSHDLLASLLGSPRLRSVVTQDVTFLPGRFVNNLFTILDRGQYPRHPAAYSWLAERAGFRVDEARTLGLGSKYVEYWWMRLSPAR